MEILLILLCIFGLGVFYQYRRVRKAEKILEELRDNAIHLRDEEKAKKCKPVTEHFHSDEEKARRAYENEVWNKRFKPTRQQSANKCLEGHYSKEDDTLSNALLASVLVNSLTEHATEVDIPATQNDNFSGDGGEFGGGGASESWDTSTTIDSGSNSDGGSFGGD